MEHLGHVFGSAMPEIESVNGLPLADIAFEQIGDGKDFSDEDFAEIFHTKLQSVKESQIIVNTDLSHMFPVGVSTKEYLINSFEQFFGQYI